MFKITKNYKILVLLGLNKVYLFVRELFVIYDHFLPFYPPNNQKNQKLKKLKKLKKTTRDIIILHIVYNKWQSYDLWFLRYWTWWTEFFVILDHFLHFYPPKNLKNQNFEKMKKLSGDIIVLHRCNINDNHMMYGSCEQHRQNFLSFWTIFCPFTPLTTWKNEEKKMKKIPGDIIIWHMCTINDNHIMYGSWDIECDRHNFL